jgi:hypothetical protein
MERVDNRQNVQKKEFWISKIKGEINYQPTQRNEIQIGKLAEEIADTLVEKAVNPKTDRTKEILNRLNLVQAKQTALSEEMVGELLKPIYVIILLVSISIATSIVFGILALL